VLTCHNRVDDMDSQAASFKGTCGHGCGRERKSSVMASAYDRGELSLSSPHWQSIISSEP
jgi:hypothetical protein